MRSMLLFSTDEYRERLARAQVAMREAKLDAMLVSAPNNLVYISGYRTNLFDSNFRPFLSLVTASGDPVLILPTLEVGVGEEVSWIEDIRSWGAAPGSVAWKGMKPVIAADSLNAARIVIEERKLTNARIGIEQGFGQRIGMSMEQFGQLKSMLPKVEWTDSTALFWKLRSVKSKTEIEYLRRASKITDAGYQTVLENAREGMTERDLQGIMGQTYMREGSDYRGFIIVQAGPERYKMMNPYATDRKVQRGDGVTFDFGAVYNGYWSDLTRTFYVGSVSPKQRELYEVSREVSAMTVEAVRPGITCEEVDAVAEQELIKRGYKEHMLHRTGHSIGLEVHELPSIGLGEKTVMQPGMTFAIEPGIYDFSVGGFRVEDIVLVTENGREYLSNCQRDLTIV
jgi:Xaa-Pro aminopeptidase